MLDLIQWPAMVATVIAAWMVDSQKKFKRNWGFLVVPVQQCAIDRVGLAQDGAYALIVLQVALRF